MILIIVGFVFSWFKSGFNRADVRNGKEILVESSLELLRLCVSSYYLVDHCQTTSDRFDAIHTKCTCKIWYSTVHYTGTTSYYLTGS